MLTKDQILEKLSQVEDPELGMNIVDLGLVYKVEIKEENGKEKAYIDITFTTPACPLINEMLHDIKSRLEEFGDNVDIEVNVVFEPLWTPDRMSDKAKMKLGLL